MLYKHLDCAHTQYHECGKKIATRIQTDGLLRESKLTSTLQSGAVTEAPSTSTPTKPKTGDNPTVNEFIAAAFSSNVNTGADFQSTEITDASKNISKSKSIDNLSSTAKTNVGKPNIVKTGAIKKVNHLNEQSLASGQHGSNAIKKHQLPPNSVSAGTTSTTNEMGLGTFDSHSTDTKRKRTRRGGVKNRAYLEKRAKDKLFQRANEEYAPPPQNAKGTQKRNRTHGETPPSHELFVY